jgi:hypothetical protein
MATDITLAKLVNFFADFKGFVHSQEGVTHQEAAFENMHDEELEAFNHMKISSVTVEIGLKIENKEVDSLK